MRVQNTAGEFVLLTTDAGYARCSWEEIVPSRIATNRKEQMQSLRWLHEQSRLPTCRTLLPTCRTLLASHDTTLPRLRPPTTPPSHDSDLRPTLTEL